MNVLFVCTGNTFRSASAEYILKDYLKKEHDTSITVSSAGTKGNPAGLFDETILELHKFNIDITAHTWRKLTFDIVDDADVIICMAKHHQMILKKQFGTDSFLYNELACATHDDVQDEAEAGILESDACFVSYVDGVIQYFYDTMPRVYGALKAMNL